MICNETRVIPLSDKHGNQKIVESFLLSITNETEKKSTVLPYEGSIYGGDLDDPKNVCLHIGGNGCAVVTLYENIGGDDFSGYAIFSLEKEEWNFIAGICREEESPAVCVGGVRPWFASADPDGCLRIYNTENGKMEQEIEMDVSAEMIREIRFAEEDRYILVQKKLNN